MREKTKLKIGEFSQMMQVTVKTLATTNKKGYCFPTKWMSGRAIVIIALNRCKGSTLSANCKVSVSRLTKSRNCTKKGHTPQVSNN